MLRGMPPHVRAGFPRGPMDHALAQFTAVLVLAAIPLPAGAAASRAGSVPRPDPAAAATVALMTAEPHAALTARDSALHVLERFAYGPSAGQVDAVAREGALAWLDGQLDWYGASDPRLAAIEKCSPALALAPDDWARRFTETRQAVKQGVPPVMARDETRELLDDVRALVVTRAVKADEQLREVMSAFWFDHFNVFLDKGDDRFLLPNFIEDVIRPRALGRFVDLLVATARSPAMLYYLDNVQSVSPENPPPPRPDGTPARRTGINENYARELLELHTLGVDGGYTQKDVIAVARILTGWSMKPPAEGGSYVFRPGVHDFGEKFVLGTRFAPGHGEEEGVRLLRLLARNPATIRHVCHKLCARLVCEAPREGCVAAGGPGGVGCAGVIGWVRRARARTPEFWAAIDAKMKTPLEFVVSAARAVDAQPDTSARLADAVAQLGEPIYRQPSPAGYPDRQRDWANSGTLLARMSFAVALAAGRQQGADVDLGALLPATGNRDSLVDAVNERILGGAMTEHTRSVIVSELGSEPDPARARALAVGLALGSPEFQRR